MAGSNEKRNKAVMDKFIKELKQLPGEFDKVSEELLNETMDVAEIYAKDLTPSLNRRCKGKVANYKDL